jgi:hypothetical protein
MDQRSDVYWEVALEAIRELDRIREIELDFGCEDCQRGVKHVHEAEIGVEFGGEQVG